MQQLIDSLSLLESRQLALLAIMSRSDAHASKCAKLGLSFGDTYPDDLAEYEDARQEYNNNEEAIATLKGEIADAEANDPIVEMPEE